MDILLVCTVGMSTSLIAEKLEIEAEKRELELTAEAAPIDNAAEMIGDYDIVLLGPQVRYQLEEVESIADKHDIPVTVIDSEAYGMMEADKILDQALAICN